MKLMQSLFAASLFATLAFGAGCSDTSNVVDDGKGVASVKVGPDKETLTKGTSLQFQATVQYADGTSKDVTSDSDTVWNTSDADLATVSRTGMVNAISEGVVAISANYLGEKGDEEFAVTP